MARWEDRFAPQPAPRKKIAQARELRRNATPAEAHAWSFLRDRRMFGLKFKRQRVIAGLIVDFYCAELKLVLEVDGGSHADPERAAYDAARTAVLETRGVGVVRVRNEDVSDRTLRDLLSHLTHRSPSPRRGEGPGGEGPEGERGQG